MSVLCLSTLLLTDSLSVVFTLMETSFGMAEVLVLVLKNVQKRLGFCSRDEQIEEM